MKQLVGIVGKAGTGKSRLARILAIHFNGEVLSFASALKGALSSISGLASFFPQVSSCQRGLLQEVGSKGRAIDPRLWINCLHSLIEFCNKDIIIIADVRYKNEAEFILEQGGDLIFLNYKPIIDLPDITYLHASEKVEQLLPLARIILDSPNFALAIEELRQYIPYNPRKPIAYIGGCISLDDDFLSAWQLIADNLFDIIDPVLAEDNEQRWLKLLQHYNIKKASQQIVQREFDLIANADMGIFYLPQVSLGAGIEIMSLKTKNAWVGAITGQIYHPYLHVFADSIICLSNLEQNIKTLRKKIIDDLYLEGGNHG